MVSDFVPEIDESVVRDILSEVSVMGLCYKCNEYTLVMEEGCEKCKNPECNWSSC